MNRLFFFQSLVLSIMLVFVGCGPAQTQNYETNPVDMDFKSYWYQGKAEVASYDLEQARYGEMRDGHAVLVFVTEDFSKSKQVKLDNAQAAGKDKVPILKLNFVKKFNTGIYPYSIMQSVFTPVQLDQYPNSLKTSMSMQEWCGHTFTQFNLQKKSYTVTGHSYFESEGDVKDELPLVLLEDEVWNLIRLAPTELPTGSHYVISGSVYSRFAHRPQKAQKAKLSREVSGEEVSYTIEYPVDKRTLTIRYAQAFPHQILGWEESYRGMTTRATLKKTMHTAYWGKNSNSDAGLRRELGLE